MTKEEIGQWLEEKECEFSRDQNKNPWISLESSGYRGMYLQTYMRFSLLISSIVLVEWLQRLAENNGTFHTIVLRNWTPELIQQVNTISNWISRAVDFWLDSVLGGYITEFSIDCTQSYSVVERELFKGPHGRYLKSLSTWIKMLLCDKGVMKMEYDHPSS
jgi:hypothetical protein